MLGNGVQLGVQGVQIVAACGQIAVEQGDLLLLLVGEGIVHFKVTGLAQTVDLLGGALLQPVLGAVETAHELLSGVGGANLLKYGLQHGDVEVHDGAKLNQQTLGHGADLVTLHHAVVHDGGVALVALTRAVVLVHLVELEVLTQDPVVEAEIEGLGGLGLGVEPQNDLRLVELQHGVGGEVQTRRRGHLARQTLDADELVALEQRRLVAEYLLRDDLGVGVRTRGSGVILSAGLKVHALVSPAHGPVDLPAQLAVEVLEEVDVAVIAATAGVVGLGAVLGDVLQSGEVGAALRAEHRHGGILSLLGVVLGRSLLLGLGHVLGLEGIQDLKDFLPLAQGLDDGLGVSARAVHITLMAVVHLDAELLHGLGELGLEVLGVVLMTAPGIGDVHVLVVGVAHLGLDVGGNLTATVKVIPGEQKASLLALLLNGLANEKGGGDITEVTDMHRARGADARGAYVLFLIGVSGDHSLGDLF